ncbi:MAG: lipoyl(octanoyl) transferase LipB [Deltaproteobacteria bacterium]|nr:lipoyl(octanoyl) transferase LipB [Deltaproteobacteria bacterium]
MIAVDLGRVSYDEGLSRQKQIHNERVAGRASDTVILLEHDPVITIGKSGGEKDLLVSEENISERGIDIRRVNRGGKITCHYPGQLVVYPIIDLSEYGNDIHAFVYNLEEVIIRTLTDFGVVGERISRLRGIFVGNNKIAAIGIEIKNSVTMHGLAFNVVEDWSLYSLFIPCGITDKGITFLESCVGPDTKFNMEIIKERVLHHFSDIFQKDIK